MIEQRGERRDQNNHGRDRNGQHHTVSHSPFAFEKWLVRQPPEDQGRAFHG